MRSSNLAAFHITYRQLHVASFVTMQSVLSFNKHQLKITTSYMCIHFLGTHSCFFVCKNMTYIYEILA